MSAIVINKFNELLKQNQMKKVAFLVMTVMVLTSFKFSGEKKEKMEPGLYVEITTSKGVILGKLEFEKTPVTVANFVALAEGKMPNTAKAAGVPFYDGLTFHRCIHTPQPFMIQGGDPAGNGSGGPGYKFNDEFDYSLKFDKPGLFAMANAGPNTNGSQFFITEGITSWLNYKHTIFGTVLKGQELIPLINNGEPMTTVKIIRVGKAAQAFDAMAIWAKKDELLAAKANAFAAEKAEMDKIVAAKKAESDKINTISADDFVKANYPNAVKTASGLYYVVEKEGAGAMAESGKTVSVHYTGRLADGTKFDSSLDRNQPISFVLGQKQVIAGWDEGIALMHVGSKYKLIIPAALGYGARGAGGVIPGNATLIFDTELMDVK